MSKTTTTPIVKPAGGIEALFSAETELRQAAWSYGRWRDAAVGNAAGQYSSEAKSVGLNDARKRLRTAALTFARLVRDIEEVRAP